MKPSLKTIVAPIALSALLGCAAPNRALEFEATFCKSRPLSAETLRALVCVRRWYGFLFNPSSPDFARSSQREALRQALYPCGVREALLPVVDNPTVDSTIYETPDEDLFTIAIGGGAVRFDLTPSAECD